MVNNFIREEIEYLLDNKKALTIWFKKKDGEEREMKCVLSPDVIDESYEYKNSTAKTSTDVKSVWDIENNGWRSFRWDSLIGYKENV